MIKPPFCVGAKRKGADQLPLFSLHRSYNLIFLYKFKSLAIICGCTTWFASGLVGNPKDRFFHDSANICFIKLRSENESDYEKMDLLDLQPGAGCSKLTTSLVNVSLKLKTLKLQIHCYILLEKCENLLQCKRYSHFSNKK